MATSTCRFCDEIIGYGRRFYDEGSDGLVHASCPEDSIA